MLAKKWRPNIFLPKRSFCRPHTLPPTVFMRRPVVNRLVRNHARALFVYYVSPTLPPEATDCSKLAPAEAYQPRICT
jgi:hypothetical protein